jgi:hypothetical protein
MLDFWDDSGGAALNEEGFQFVRSTGETTWTLKELPGLHDFLTYEAELNRFLPRYPQVIMCLYDLDHFGGEILVDILKTHPKVLMGGTVLENLSAPRGALTYPLRSREGLEVIIPGSHGLPGLERERGQ